MSPLKELAQRLTGWICGAGHRGILSSLKILLQFWWSTNLHTFKAIISPNDSLFILEVDFLQFAWKIVRVEDTFLIVAGRLSLITRQCWGSPPYGYTNSVAEIIKVQIILIRKTDRPSNKNLVLPHFAWSLISCLMWGNCLKSTGIKPCHDSFYN